MQLIFHLQRGHKGSGYGNIVSKIYEVSGRSLYVNRAITSALRPSRCAATSSFGARRLLGDAIVIWFCSMRMGRYEQPRSRPRRGPPRSPGDDGVSLQVRPLQRGHWRPGYSKAVSKICKVSCRSFYLSCSITSALRPSRCAATSSDAGRELVKGVVPAPVVPESDRQLNVPTIFDWPAFSSFAFCLHRPAGHLSRWSSLSFRQSGNVKSGWLLPVRQWPSAALIHLILVSFTDASSVLAES